MATKVLLDTDMDILGDIDDALCLAYLLEQPACDLLGITTVTYDTAKRAMVASALCRAAGKQVPIFPGASIPLLAALPHIDASSPAASEEDAALQRWEHAQSFRQGEAVEFMRRVIRDNPGEVVLLAVGPLTNVALLFGVDAEIPRLLKGLVLMCGAFADGAEGRGRTPEWNARFDPHATAIVYRAGVNVHRSTGLDVTEQVKMDAPAFNREFRSRTYHPIADFAEAWFRHRPTITFHDPLAAVTLFDEQVCRFERGTVEVEVAQEQMLGATYWTPGDPTGRHEVALIVDPARFFEHYFGVFR